VASEKESQEREVPTIDEAVQRARVEYHRHGFGWASVEPAVAKCRCGTAFIYGEKTLMEQYETHLFERVLGFARGGDG